MVFLTSVSENAAADSQWKCQPGLNLDDPNLTISSTIDSSKANVILNKDLVRSQGTLKAGTYVGSLKTDGSLDGTVEVDVSQSFTPPDGEAPSILAIPVYFNSDQSISDVYLLFGGDTSTDGIELDRYVCQMSH